MAGVRRDALGRVHTLAEAGAAGVASQAALDAGGDGEGASGEERVGEEGGGEHRGYRASDEYHSGEGGLAGGRPGALRCETASGPAFIQCGRAFVISPYGREVVHLAASAIPEDAVHGAETPERRFVRLA